MKKTKGMELTKREKEILLYIANGLSSKEIADKLFISVNTVANHRQNMIMKSGAKNMAELMQQYNDIFLNKNSDL